MRYSKAKNPMLYSIFFEYPTVDEIDLHKLSEKHDQSISKLAAMKGELMKNPKIFLELVLNHGIDHENIPHWVTRPKKWRKKQARRIKTKTIPQTPPTIIPENLRVAGILQAIQSLANQDEHREPTPYRVPPPVLITEDFPMTQSSSNDRFWERVLVRYNEANRPLSPYDYEVMYQQDRVKWMYEQEMERQMIIARNENWFYWMRFIYFLQES